MNVHVISSSVSARLTERVCDALRRNIAGAAITNGDLAAIGEGPDSFGLERPALTVIVRHDGEEAQVLALLARRAQDDTRSIIVVGSAADSKFMLSALRSGADEYLDEADLGAEMEIVLSRLRTGHTALAAMQVVGILAAGGGSGASTIAVNLAARWASKHGRSILFDLKPGRGDLGTLLDLTPSYSLAHACANETRLDRSMLESILANHSSGISLLASPPDPASARSLNPESVLSALRLARAMVPVVVADLASVETESQLAFVSHLTHCFLVCRLDFSSLRQARRVLADLEKASLPADKVSVVANQVGRPGELSTEEAEQALGHTIKFLVPYEPRIVIEANNTGIPTLLSHPNSRFAQALLGMAGVTCTTHPKGLLPKLKGLCGFCS